MATKRVSQSEEIKRLKTALSCERVKSSRLSVKCRKQVAEIEELMGRVSALRREIIGLNAENANLRFSSETVVKELNLVRGTRRELEVRIQELEAIIRSNQRVSDTINDQMAELGRRCVGLERKLEETEISLQREKETCKIKKGIVDELGGIIISAIGNT